MVFTFNGDQDTEMIEGSPITVCRRCGTAYSAVVLGTCQECDRADWELCGPITTESGNISSKLVFEKAVTNG